MEKNTKNRANSWFTCIYIGSSRVAFEDKAGGIVERLHSGRKYNEDARIIDYSSDILLESENELEKSQRSKK